MKFLQIVTTIAAIAYPIGWSPAQAQANPVRACILDCAYPDFTNPWCVIACNDKYGNEESGGGAPEQTGPYIPGVMCYGSSLGCNPDERPK
jgi:hypothetical protein